MTIRTSHNINLRKAGALHPFQQSNLFSCCGGVTLGRNIDTGHPVLIDPYRWKRHGHIGATIALCLAKINGGKTSLAIALALKLGMLKAAYERRIRVTLDEHRRNHGQLEYQRYVDFCGYKYISLHDNPINMLSPDTGLSRAAMLNMMVETIEYITKDKLNHYDITVLMVALAMMFDMTSSTASKEQLLDIIQRLMPKDINSFIETEKKPLLRQLQTDSIDTHLQAIEATATGEIPWQFSAEERIRQSVQIDSERLQGSIAKLVFALSRLGKYGDFGGTFGGADSMQGLDQRVVAVDLTQLNPATVSLVQSWWWRVKGAAHESADPLRSFQLEIHDENHKLWNDPVYQRAMPAYMKLIRATGSFLILNSHRPADYDAVAGEGGLLAQNALDEVEVLFLGQQSPSVARRVRERFDLPKSVAERLPLLGMGQFCLIVGTSSPVYVQIDLTPQMLELCETNQANQEMFV